MMYRDEPGVDGVIFVCPSDIVPQFPLEPAVLLELCMSDDLGVASRLIGGTLLSARD